MDERWESMSAVVANVAYAAAALALVVLSVPALRAGLASLAGRQVHAWRYGLWLGRQTRAPSWTMLLSREDLPAEQV